MTSLAWSSLALLVLLLPGFSFLIGLYTPERFARDVTPRNPLSALAAIVLTSLIAHTALSALVGLSGRWVVEWPAVLEAVQMAPRTAADSTAAFTQTGRRFQEQGWVITAYVVTSCVVGYWVGRACGWAIVRGWFRAVAVQHRWVYPLQPGRGGVMTYAHVLTDIGDNGKVVIYRGRLKYFALAANGTFDYMVLAATGQRFLRLDGNQPHLGEIREIGDYRVPLPRSLPPLKVEGYGEWMGRWAVHPLLSRKKRGERKRAEAFRATAEQRATDKALMMIPGTSIQNVVFQGLYQIPLIDYTRDRARDLRQTIAGGVQDEITELDALREFRGERMPTAAAMTTLEVQESLAALGFTPGPRDGVVGIQTRTAIRKFQDQQGLHPDGDAGPLTSARIRDLRARAADGTRQPINGERRQ